MSLSLRSYRWLCGLLRTIIVSFTATCRCLCVHVLDTTSWNHSLRAIAHSTTYWGLGIDAFALASSYRCLIISALALADHFRIIWRTCCTFQISMPWICAFAGATHSLMLWCTHSRSVHLSLTEAVITRSRYPYLLLVTIYIYALLLSLQQITLSFSPSHTGVFLCVLSILLPLIPMICVRALATHWSMS